MSELYPKNVFEYFKKICTIPHGSYNTKHIADYLVSFAEGKNLEYVRDSADNVIIYKKASVGKENSEPIILQGHTDMVCASVGDFDFENNPITVNTDGKYIFASGTTLGGDNGIGAAMMLSLLDSELSLPALECVFTSNEEVGMLGAVELDMSLLKSRRMLNLDSEEEGIFTIGCAGGVTLDITSGVGVHTCCENCFSLEIGGLHGGHSGVEINGGYANAIKVMCDIMAQISKENAVELISLKGGVADNAIPKSCICVFGACGEDAYENINRCAETVLDFVKQNYNDPEVYYKLNKSDNSNTISVIREDSYRILSVIDSLPNGIMAYEAGMDNTPKTSCNMGVVNLDENGFVLRMSLRSSSNDEKQSLADSVANTVSVLGAICSSEGSYPAWEPVVNSDFCGKAAQMYKQMYKKEPVVEVIHAGLECSVFSDRIKGLDCISIGPDMQGIHTPDEKVDIASVGKVYDFVCELLKNI